MTEDERTSDDALAAARTAADEAAAAFGPEDERAVLALERLAFLHHARQEPHPASTCYRRVLLHRFRRNGVDGEETLSAARMLADVLRRAGEHDESLAVHELVLARTVARYGEDSQQAVMSRYSHALIRHLTGDRERARRELTELLPRIEAELGTDHAIASDVRDRLTAWPE